jgi:outer membrane lipoprotein SlyB
MKTIKRYLLKLLVGAVIGAVVGTLLSGWLVLGHSVVIVAILGALVCALLGTLYDPNVVVHSSPTSRGETSPYNRDD